MTDRSVGLGIRCTDRNLRHQEHANRREALIKRRSPPASIKPAPQRETELQQPKAECGYESRVCISHSSLSAEHHQQAPDPRQGTEVSAPLIARSNTPVGA